MDIEMDGKMLNSHGVDFLDGPLGLDLDEKDLDEEETRRDMAKILKELKQKHPDKEVGRIFHGSKLQVKWHSGGFCLSELEKNLYQVSLCFRWNSSLSWPTTRS